MNVEAALGSGTGVRPAVGLVGLGSMGSGIAGNLLRAGWALTVNDRSAERVATMVHIGATAGDLATIARQQTVLLSLPGPTQVTDVSRALLPAMSPGSVLVNLSTIGVTQARELAAEAESQGVHCVDAPVTGAADGARAGTLVIMAGASLEAFRLAEPALRPISRAIHHVGPAGAGTAAKLLTNMLWFIHVTALADALALGALEGLDPTVFGDVIRDSAGGSWVAEHDLPNVLAGDDDASFALALCTKDLRLIGELAATHGFPPAYATLAAERFGAAESRFGSGAGELAVTRLVEESAGVSIRAKAD